MALRIELLAERIEAQFAGRVTRIASTCGELSYELGADDLLSICTSLRDGVDFKFEQLIDPTGLDYLDYGQVEWSTQESTGTGFSRGVARGAESLPASAAGRFAVVCHLLSVTNNIRVRLRVRIANNLADNDAPMIDSLVGVWASANWFEREAFDMFGILFKGHPDLRRILTDYGFIGHPFRKDFPLIGNVEVRYDEAKGRVIYQPVSIEPRTLVPRVIRDDNRYDPALK
jgi:NADH-quinone oxidoreductase subunit C